VAKDPLDRPFAAPLDQFVSVRNDLARQLRDDGKRDEAERVKAMRKPTAVVWALNQLARNDRAGIRQLLKLADRLRAVQTGRSRASFQEAQRDFSTATWRLAKQATGLLSETGRRPPPSMTQRLNRALMAAAASPETSNVLRAGRLTEEPETIGFGGIGEVKITPATRRRREDNERQDRERQSRVANQTAKREQAEAEREQRRRQREEAEHENVEAAQRDVRAAKGEVARLSRQLEQAQTRLDRAEEKLKQLQSR
jgi:hypothetical protein